MNRKININLKKLNASDEQKVAIQSEIAKVLHKHLKKIKRSKKGEEAKDFNLSLEDISNVKTCYPTVIIKAEFKGAVNGLLEISFKNQFETLKKNGEKKLHNICAGDTITLYGNNGSGKILVTIDVAANPSLAIIDDIHPNGHFFILNPQI